MPGELLSRFFASTGLLGGRDVGAVSCSIRVTVPS
jgi:hypothetical protein